MENGRRNKLFSDTDEIANALGWFSIGLGLAEVLAPKTLSRLIGVKPNPGLLRVYGAREIASGLGILSQKGKQDRWLKARVAGDALDLLSLGGAMAATGSKRGKLSVATAAVLGVTAIDLLCAARASKQPFRRGEALPVRRSITVGRKPEEVYRFWRNLEQLPQFMNHLLAVKDLGNNRWHWVAKGPAGVRVEWDAQITEDRPNELIAWRSLSGSDVDHAGEVRFEPAPGERGTVIRVQMEYHPPAGKIGAAFAKILGEAPEKQIAVDLLRCKQLLETGEIARTEGQPAGRSRSTSRKYDDFVRT